MNQYKGVNQPYQQGGQMVVQQQGALTQTPNTYGVSGPQVVLKSSQSLAVTHGVKLLIFARAGMGKTMLTATAPNPILISAESGMLSLSKQNIERVFGVNTPGITYNIPTIEITTIADLINAEQWARNSGEARQFQTVCIDSLSEIGEKVLENAKGQVKDPRQAYGELLDKMGPTIKAFRDLSGKHVYMSAKEERIQDESNGSVLAGPGMPGKKLGPQLPYLFDEVFQLNTAKDPKDQSSYRYLRTAPDFNVDAKDRSGALSEIERPHLGYIIAKIMGAPA